MRAWLLGALRLLPFAVALFVPRLLFEARGDDGLLILVPCALGSAAVFTVLMYRMRRHTRLRHRRFWWRAAAVLGAATLASTVVYSVAFQRWTFVYELEGPSARHIAGSEYTPRALAWMPRTPERVSDLVADLGGSESLDVVWTAASIERHRMVLALLFSLLAISLCGTVFAAVELSGLEEPRALRFPAIAPKTIVARRSARTFDVFLCHNSRDKEAVKAIALRLIGAGILPWLDEWELRPGTRWGPAIDAELRTVRAAAVFVGPSGEGPWQSMEMWALLDLCARRGVPVIPVLLASQTAPDLPVFLSGLTWVDMTKSDPDPFEQLVWGVRGTKPA